MDRYAALMRSRLLEEILGRMTPEEKKALAVMSAQDSRDEEILRAVRQNGRHLEKLLEKAGKDRWWVAFGSDVAANILTNAGAWLLTRIMARR